MTITSPHLGSPSSEWTDARLLYALEEVVEKELNRHLKVAKDWMPHEYVPWSDARNFPGIFEDGEAWEQGAVQGHRHRPDRPGRQPPHRGQPPQLPPRDRLPLRPRRRLGHLGAPLDRGGGPARHRDARLPARLPRRRPGQARAVPHAAHGGGLRVGQPALDAALGGVRRLPGAGHPRLAPQHRPPVRRPGLRPHAGPHRDRREPAHGLLPEPAEAPRSSSRPT